MHQPFDTGLSLRRYLPTVTTRGMRVGDRIGSWHNRKTSQTRDHPKYFVIFFIVHNKHNLKTSSLKLLNVVMYFRDELLMYCRLLHLLLFFTLFLYISCRFCRRFDIWSILLVRIYLNINTLAFTVASALKHGGVYMYDLIIAEVTSYTYKNIGPHCWWPISQSYALFRLVKAYGK